LISALLSKIGSKALPVARSLLSDALRIDPTNRMAWYYLGMVHRDDGRIADAADCFQAASMLEESDPIESFVYILWLASIYQPVTFLLGEILVMYTFFFPWSRYTHAWGWFCQLNLLFRILPFILFFILPWSRYKAKVEVETMLFKLILGKKLKKRKERSYSIW
jgi:tetratricopeptide (TPR) repeat protein